MARRLSSIYGQTLKSSSDAPGISTSKNLVIGSDKITSALSAIDFPLQVSAGVYISGSVGIGTTNPTSKLTVQGDGKFTGVVTATKFVGDGSSLTGIISGIEVKEEGVGIGSTFTSINFIGAGVTATVSGSTAVVTFTQQVGPQGTTGAQGAQGTTGAQGAQGTTGAQGAQGTTGAQGAQGPQGAGGLTTTTATSLSGGSVAATTGTFSNYLRTLEQVRATGWYGTPTGSSYTGLAVEMGVSSGSGYTLCYNRDAGTYGNFNLAGASTNILLPSSGTTITVTGSISASGSVAGTNITSGGNVTGSSASCTGNSATATTATNQSGGTVSATTGSFSSTTNIGSGTMGLAQLNVQQGQGSVTTFRDIDFHGSWSSGEGHSISAAHGSTSANLVGQMVFQHDSPGSRIKWGRLYHSGDQSTYPMNLISLDSSGNAQLTMSAGSDMRSPIFYDSNNTAYYVDPASGSNLAGTLTNNSGTTMTGGWNRNLYLVSTFPVIVFNSNSTKYSAIGVDYSTAVGGMYFWVNGSSADISGTGTVAMNIYTSNYVQASGSFRAPIFYDSDNTGYYTDPASNSLLNTFQTAGYVVIGGNFTNNPYNSAPGARLMFGGGDAGAQAGYYVGTNLNSYGGNYTKLDLSWHTGIRIGAQGVYGGVRFFSTETFATQIFSVGETDGNVRVTNDIRSPIYYDSNDTSYYTDPASTSILNDTRHNSIVAGSTSAMSGGPGPIAIYRSSGPYISFHDGTTARTAYFQETAGRFYFGEVPYTESEGSFRAPLFYDTNNTGYYCDPASTSNLNGLTANSTFTVNNGWSYVANNYGYGIVGLYTHTIFQLVFAMGDSYKTTAGGGISNLYGIAWSYPSAGGIAGNLDSHGLIVAINGGFGSCMSYSIKASGNVTAYSDERLKTNWKNLPEDFVELLSKVKSGSYDRIDGEQLRQVGASAQSLRPILPEAVIEATDEFKTLSISYGNAALVSAIELAKEVVNLKEQLNSQNTIIQSLINRMELLETN